MDPKAHIILNEHTKHLERIDKTLDAITNKIPALFDAFSMVSAKQEQQEERIDHLEEKLENHSMKIASLEIISSQN